MSKIKLDPIELKNQADEMLTLSSKYESLFSDVNTTLNKVNSNWSPNLANNFSSKIVNAQKSFSNIVEMLKIGGNAANGSAESFLSIDAQLAKGISKSAYGGGKGAFGSGTGGGGFRGENIENGYDLINSESKKIKETYDKIPKWAEKIIEDYLEELGLEDYKEVYELVIYTLAEKPEDIVALDVDPKIVKTIFELVGYENIYADTISETYGLVIDSTGDFGVFMEAHEQYLNKATDLGREGDIVGALKNLGLSCGIGLYGIGYGTFEVLTEVGANALEEGVELGVSIMELMGGIIPGKSGEVLEDATDMFDSGVKIVADWIRDWY